MAFNYEYEFDGEYLLRWHLPSERIAEVARCSDEFTAINRAKRDFGRLANLAKGKGQELKAVWHFGGGNRTPILEA